MNDEKSGETGSTDGPSSAGRTGHDAVDAVLDRLDDLEDAPLTEHVRVFEQAHEDLRAALSDASPTAS